MIVYTNIFCSVKNNHAEMGTLRKFISRKAVCRLADEPTSRFVCRADFLLRFFESLEDFVHLLCFIDRRFGYV
jgi:hypothetical protein